MRLENIPPTVTSQGSTAPSFEPDARRRSVPVTTISPCRLPHMEQTSRSRQLSTGVSAPYRAAISAGSGSTARWLPLHQNSKPRRAAAAVPDRVRGPPQGVTDARPANRPVAAWLGVHLLFSLF